ncbi:MAG TPA: phosphatidylserine/phosphatidylglycerophosphate/cardiolipin synthase family protein [Polyangia bacterium]
MTTFLGGARAACAEEHREATTDAHGLTLFVDMESFLVDAFARIETARRRIFVETFIIKPDALGETLLGKLERAAHRGLDVRVLYDGSGSHELPRSRVAQLRSHGVKTHRYGLIPPVGFLRTGFRDHARLLLVDDTAYTGGHAWAKDWLPRDRGGEGWSDVNCSVTGPLCETWRRLYEARWGGGPSLWPVSLDTQDTHRDVRLISDAPGVPHRILDAHLEAAAQATKRIWLGNAYFFPTEDLLTALSEARARGVDVKVMLPGVSDLALVARAARSCYERWLSRGLDIYEFDQVMMHGKYAVIDDDWVTVGSFNALGVSMSYAIESNLIIRDRRIVEQAAQHFLAQLKQSLPVTPTRHRARRRATKVVDFLAWAVMQFFAGALVQVTAFWRFSARVIDFVVARWFRTRLRWSRARIDRGGAHRA